MDNQTEIECPDCYGKGWIGTTREWKPARRHCYGCRGTGRIEPEPPPAESEPRTGKDALASAAPRRSLSALVELHKIVDRARREARRVMDTENTLRAQAIYDEIVRVSGALAIVEIWFARKEMEAPKGNVRISDDAT